MRKPNGIWWLFKLSFPLALLAFVLLATFGYVSSWPVADQALASYSKEKRVLVAFAYSNRYSSSGSERTVSASYLLMPSAFMDVSVVTVTQVNDLAPVVSWSRGQFFGLLLAYAVCGIGTWWFWLRARATQQALPGDARNART